MPRACRHAGFGPRGASLLCAIAVAFLMFCFGALAPAAYGAADSAYGYDLDSTSTTAPASVASAAAVPEAATEGSSRSAAIVFRGFSAAEDTATVVRGGENAFTAYGRAVHAAYDYVPGFQKESTLENGQRVDAVNFETREVVELKPNNPRAIARGESQVAGYADQLTKEFLGDPFSYRVQTYDRP